MLGVHFLASEFRCGVRRTGRIDTAGIDVKGAPVAIEYERTISANVLPKGLHYLDSYDDGRYDCQAVRQSARRIDLVKYYSADGTSWYWNDSTLATVWGFGSWK
jgi:hypothetical protein